MKMLTFCTAWGIREPLPSLARRAHAAGYDGLESPMPDDASERAELAAVLAELGMPWIMEVCTAGSYVPRRAASPQAHADDLRVALEQCAATPELNPIRVNCLGGLDAWPEPVTERFLREGIAQAAALGLSLSFETHRSRSLFNPWVTARMLAALPELRLTADISHWCVVAERLMDTEPEVIAQMAAHVDHIHARVGYDQGPQVPHPAAPEYQHCLASHQHCWAQFWQAQHAAGMTETTLTPEFGPDGYLHLAPFSREPVGDLWDINKWMAETERGHFQRWQLEHTHDTEKLE